MRRTNIGACIVLSALLVDFDARAGKQVWSFTGNMHYYHTSHTATLLNNGEVLVAGGYGLGTGYQTYAELYNPSSGAFTLTGSLNTGRTRHAAALLPGGEVLIVGGLGSGNSAFNCLASAELYNPATETFTNTGSLNTTTCYPRAVLLNTGKVLVINGTGAELYDPSSGQFSVTGNLNNPRADYTATLLQNGNVLVVGGDYGSTTYLSSAEIYDPAAGRFTLTGSLHTSRALHTATLMNNGEVLVAGGLTYIGPGYEILSSAEVYNPATGSFAATGSMNEFRFSQSAVLLASGQVLEATGDDTTTAELYDPTKGTFTYTASLNDLRETGQGINLLNDGVVLVTGGNWYYNGRPRLWNTAEVYH
jgi:hypothetical protein